MKFINRQIIISTIITILIILGFASNVKADFSPIHLDWIKVTDVPNDQGGTLNINWSKLSDPSIPADYHEYPEYPNKKFDAYIVLKNESEPDKGGGENVCQTQNLDQTTCIDNNARTGEPLWYWVVPCYKYIDPTLKQEFCQVASIPETGWIKGISIDNLPPAKPTGIKLDNIENKLEITWQKNTEPDIGTYMVNFYSSNASSEKAGKSFTTYGPEFTIELDKYYQDYKFISVQAKDKNNNLSPETELAAIPESKVAAEQRSVTQQPDRIQPPYRFPSNREDYFAIGGLLIIVLILALYFIYRRQEKRSKKDKAIESSNNIKKQDRAIPNTTDRISLVPYQEEETIDSTAPPSRIKLIICGLITFIIPSFFAYLIYSNKDEVVPIYLLIIIWVALLLFTSFLFLNYFLPSIKKRIKKYPFINTILFRAARVSIVVVVLALIPFWGKFLSPKIFTGLMAPFWIAVLMFFVFWTFCLLLEFVVYSHQELFDNQSLRYNSEENHSSYLGQLGWHFFKIRPHILKKTTRKITPNDGRAYRDQKLYYFLLFFTFILFSIVSTNLFQYGFADGEPLGKAKYSNEIIGVTVSLYPHDGKWAIEEEQLKQGQEYRVSFGRRPSDGGQGFGLRQRMYSEEYFNPAPKSLEDFYAKELAEEKQFEEIRQKNLDSKQDFNKKIIVSQENISHNGWEGKFIKYDYPNRGDNCWVEWEVLVNHNNQYYNVYYSFCDDRPRENDQTYNINKAQNDFDSILKSLKFSK